MLVSVQVDYSRLKYNYTKYMNKNMCSFVCGKCEKEAITIFPSYYHTSFRKIDGRQLGVQGVSFGRIDKKAHAK